MRKRMSAFEKNLTIVTGEGCYWLCKRCEQAKPLMSFAKTITGGRMVVCRECWLKKTCINGHDFTEALPTLHKGDLRPRRRCLICHQEKCRKAATTYRERNRKITDKRCELNRRLTKYGVTEAEYNSRFEKQKGLCDLPSCGQPIGATDHCHKTQKFRGLLCRNHNAGLGFFKDNPQLLKEAALYLEVFSSGGSPSL